MPDQALDVCTTALPSLRFTCLPAAIHWASTFPLLTARCERDRMHRPVYRYVQSLGYSSIEDWFLPFLCAPYDVSREPLLRLVGSSPPRSRPYAVLSVRDKGFLWWPDQSLCAEVERQLSSTLEVVYAGVENERPPWLPELQTSHTAVEALRLSYHSNLFVGTDTGLATVRELTGKKNIYCISRFWLEEVMIRYGYVDAHILRASPSVFAFHGADLLKHLNASVAA